MKTTKIQKSTSSNSHNSKPFFNKIEEGSFFSQTKKTEKPFFSPPSIQPKKIISHISKGKNLIQKQSYAEDIEQSVNESLSDEASFLTLAGSIESGFPSDLTNPRRGYMSFQGGRRLLRRLRQLDRISEIIHIMESFRHITEGAGGLRYLDRNLTLAIAFRESGSRILSRRIRRVNSFRAGGLDRLYGERRRLIREGFIPREIANRWTRGTSDPTEGSTSTRERHSNPVMLPERDLIIAYGGVVSERRQRFERVAERYGMSTSGLSTRARRVWTALFFGGSGGLNYAAFRRQLRNHRNERGWIGSHFGAQTILTFLANNGHTLNDVLNLETLAPDLYNMGRTKSAFIVVAEAEVLDEVIKCRRTR